MKKITFLFVLFLLTSCGNFKVATLNHTPKSFVTSQGIAVDVVDSEFGLYRKFNNDSKFKWNFTQFALDQDLRWYYSFYNRNFLWKYNRNISPWDIYVNRYDYWFDWNFNFGWRGYNHWDPYGFRNWGWNSWDPYYSNIHIWNRQTIAYAKTRRGSQYNNNLERNNIVQRNYNNVRSYNNSRNNNTNVRVYNRPENNDAEIRRSVDLLKIGNKNINIREYNNPNQFNNDKTIRPDIRGYGRPESGNNGRGGWSREIIPPSTTRSQISTPSQSGQIRRGSGPSSVQQTGTSRSSSGPGSRGVRR